MDCWTAFLFLSSYRPINISARACHLHSSSSPCSTIPAVVPRRSARTAFTPSSQAPARSYIMVFALSIDVRFTACCLFLPLQSSPVVRAVTHRPSHAGAGAVHGTARWAERRTAGRHPTPVLAPPLNVIVTQCQMVAGLRVLFSCV